MKISDTVAFLDNRITAEIESNLSDLGLKIAKVASNKFLPEPVSAHPDMNMFFSNNIAVVDISCSKIIHNILPDFELISVDFEAKSAKISSKSDENDAKILKYPHDISLNCAKIGEMLVCNERYASPEILALHRGRVINVKQGYSKCSLIVLNDNSAITDDIGIGIALEKEGVDVLTVNKGDVMLDGYDYGFIGGASGMIDKSHLAFFGDIESHGEHNRIIDFCTEKGIGIINLSRDRLYDYGSLICIEERSTANCTE